MRPLLEKFKRYLYNSDIDINERLSTFFIYIGIVAACLGTLLCVVAHASPLGIASTAFIAVGATLLSVAADHVPQLRGKLGRIIAVSLIIMMPIVWLSAGGSHSGVNAWFVYELFFMALFTTSRTVLIYTVPAIVLQVACFLIEDRWPELVFHYATMQETYISIIGSIAIVSITVFATVMVQKSLYEHEREQKDRTEDFTKEFVTSVASIIDAKDSYTGSHSKRVATCSAAIARHMGMSEEEAENVYLVGLLHDIGKIAVPDIVLNKPGRLTDEEFTLIRRHPQVGAEILDGLDMIPHVKEGALYHHERYDGKGYPFGLSGEAIPLYARLICVADSYDAMSTSRVYRARLGREEVISELIRCRGQQFDPQITDAFVEMLLSGFQVEENEEEPTASAEQRLSRLTKQLVRKAAAASRAPIPAPAHYRGALSLDGGEFSRMYAYVRNLGGRFGYHLMLSEIRLEYAGEVAHEQVERHVILLSEAIRSTIRAVDVCTRYGSSGYLMVMLNAQPEDMEPILQRISARFGELCPDTGIQVHYRVLEEPDWDSVVTHDPGSAP